MWRVCERRQSASIPQQRIRARRGETAADVMTRGERMGAAAWVGPQHPAQGTDPAWISKSSLPLTLRLIFKSWLQSIRSQSGICTRTYAAFTACPAASAALKSSSLTGCSFSDSCIYKYCIKRKLHTPRLFSHHGRDWTTGGGMTTYGGTSHLS